MPKTTNASTNSAIVNAFFFIRTICAIALVIASKFYYKWAYLALFARHMTLIPTIIDKTPQGERAYDIYSRLLEDRIIFVGEAINDAVANTVIAQLLYLEKKDPDKDITMYINSPGGSISAGYAIYDTMQFVACDIQTICI